MNYKNFKIRIDRATQNGFAVSVESPAGEETSEMILPFSADEILGKLGQISGHVRGETRKAELASEPRVAPSEIGADLYGALFAGSVGRAYDRSLGMCDGEDEGLRIKLALNLEDEEVRKLAQIPWEYLCEKESTEAFLNLSKKTPIVRYIDALEPQRASALEGKLKVLVVLSSPGGVAKLDLSKERSLIEDSWANETAIEAAYIENPTANQLLEKLSADNYHVLHYMGHGTSTGLVLSDDQGDAAILPASTIGVWLGDLPSLRLVFINACDTAKVDEDSPIAGVATRLVAEGLPAVLAMQFPITDTAAINFARAFYTRLVVGASVDEAVAQGRKAILGVATNSLEWGTPVLFMRAPDGRLFATSQAQAQPKPKPTPTLQGRPALIKGLLGTAAAVVLAVLAYYMFTPSDAGLQLDTAARDEALVVPLGGVSSVRLDVVTSDPDAVIQGGDLSRFEPVEFVNPPGGHYEVVDVKRVKKGNKVGWVAKIKGLKMAPDGSPFIGDLEVTRNTGSDEEVTLTGKIEVQLGAEQSSALDRLASDRVNPQVKTSDLIDAYTKELEKDVSLFPEAIRAQLSDQLNKLNAAKVARDTVAAYLIAEPVVSASGENTYPSKTVLMQKHAELQNYAAAFADARGFELESSFDAELYSTLSALPKISGNIVVCDRVIEGGSSTLCSTSRSRIPKGRGAEVFATVTDNSGGRDQYRAWYVRENGTVYRKSRNPIELPGTFSKRAIPFRGMNEVGKFSVQLRNSSEQVIAEQALEVY